MLKEEKTKPESETKTKKGYLKSKNFKKSDLKTID